MKPVDLSLERLSATSLSQSDLLGMCSLCVAQPRKALITYKLLKRMEAHSSPFIYPFWWPNTQDILSVLKMTCWFCRDLGIRRKGRIMPTISRVAVLLPKRLPLLSFWDVMKDFGHQSWVIRQTEPISFMPMTPQPMLPSQELLQGRPAASEVNIFVQIGGWFGGLQMGIQGEASFKKPHQTNISDKALGVRSINLLESFSKFFKHLRMLNLKQRRNGHI